MPIVIRSAAMLQSLFMTSASNDIIHKVINKVAQRLPKNFPNMMLSDHLA